jgi:Na+-driven multidrug efflux pump
VLGYFLCYYQNLGLIGIWLGWMVGMIMNLIISINRLRSKDIELRIGQKDKIGMP